jgi:hypothetical protein
MYGTRYAQGALGAALIFTLSACGGSSGGFGGSAFSGLAVDPYIAGATVAYTCQSGQTGTVTTDSSGAFTLPAGCASPSVHVTGGGDIGYGVPFDSYLDAPSGSKVASQLTTFIAAAPASKTALLSFLGAGSADPTQTDPLTNSQLLVADLAAVQMRAATVAGMVALPGASLTTLSAATPVISGINTAATQGVSLNEAGIEAAISAAVVAAANAQILPSALLAGGSSTLGTNIAVLIGPSVLAQVQAVQAALAGATISADGHDTLNALIASGQMTKLATLIGSVDNISSLVSAQSAATLASADSTAALRTTGQNAAASATVYKNFVAAGDTVQIGGSAQTATTIETLASTGVTLPGPLNSIGVSLSLDGNAFTSTAQASIGFSYSGAGVSGAYIISPMVLAGSAGSSVSSITAPSGATVSFSVTLANGTTASGNITNVSADDILASSSGDGSSPVLTLDIATFLQRLANRFGTGSVQYQALSGALPTKGTYSFGVALAPVTGQALKIGRDVSSTGQAAAPVAVNANGTTLAGQGLSGTLILQ